MYNSCSAPCFDGNCLVTCYTPNNNNNSNNNSYSNSNSINNHQLIKTENYFYKKVKDLRSGDQVILADQTTVAEIQFILKTIILSADDPAPALSTSLCKLPQGLIITPWHPIR